MDVGVGLGGGVHLQRHEVKEEVGGLMDLGDRGDKRKEDFSTLYSLDHGPPAPTPSHASTTPPRTLQDQTGEARPPGEGRRATPNTPRCEGGRVGEGGRKWRKREKGNDKERLGSEGKIEEEKGNERGKGSVKSRKGKIILKKIRRGGGDNEKVEHEQENKRKRKRERERERERE